MTIENVNTPEPLLSCRIRTELADLAQSINAMVKTLKEMELPIRESRLKLPQACQHVVNITARTEAAAYGMLKHVEHIIEHQNKISKLSDDISRLILTSQIRHKDDIEGRIEGIRDMASDSQNSAFLIMDTLQFQDITSQQADYVSQLLEYVEHRLHQLQRIMTGALQPDELESSDIDDCPSESCSPCIGKDQEEVDVIVSRAVEEQT